MAQNSVTRLRWLRCTAMIFDGRDGRQVNSLLGCDPAAICRRRGPRPRGAPGRWRRRAGSAGTPACRPPNGPRGRRGWPVPMSRRALSSRRLSGRRPSSRGRPVEPQVHLRGADRVLVVAERPGRCGHRVAAERPDHHQVVRELGLWPHREVFTHRVYHPGVLACPQPADPVSVCRPGMGCSDVRRGRWPRAPGAHAAARTCATARQRR